MTIQETYLRFLNKVNKNFINDNISVDKGRFIILFNSSQLKYFDWIFAQKNTDSIRDVQSLKVSNKELEKSKKYDDFDSFSLPNNFFKHVNVRAKAKSFSCVDFLDNLFEAKGENIHELYNDKNNEPSFEYRETFYTFGNNCINVYKKDFDISNVFLTYYRYPISVDIEGYIKKDGSHSKNIDPEFNDEVIDSILDICAKDFNVNSDNLERYQVDNNQIVSTF